MGITITPKRNLKVVFLGPYLVTGQSILARRSVVEHVKGPKDINNPDFKLVVTSGTTSETAARALAPKAAIITVSNMEDAFKMVKDKAADALFADQPFCVVMAFMNQDLELAVSEPFTFEPLGIAVPQTDILWINWVDNFVLNLNANGKLKALKEFWFSNPSWMERLPDSERMLYKTSM